MRRQTVVQRHARALVLEDEPFVARDELAYGRGRAVQRLHRETVAVAFAAGVAALGAVLTGDRQLQRVEQRVDAGERTPAHQRQRAAGGAVQPRHEVGLRPLDAHVVGVSLDVEQRAVDVEEERPVGGKRRHA